MMKVFVLAYFILFYAANIGRGWWMWKKTGVNPVVFGRTVSAHDLLGRIFKICSVLAALTMWVYLIGGRIYACLSPIVWLEHPRVAPLGAALMAAGFVLVMVGQSHMGPSWRVGVSAVQNTALVLRGVYRYSRNPIYVGMILSMTGYVLIAPNAATFALWAVGMVTIPVQVRLEEEYLRQAHGAAYDDYRGRVRRWI